MFFNFLYKILFSIEQLPLSIRDLIVIPFFPTGMKMLSEYLTDLEHTLFFSCWNI